MDKDRLNQHKVIRPDGTDDRDNTAEREAENKKLAEAVRKYQGGDEEAFNDIFDIVYPYIWNTAKGYGISPNDIEDITQNALEKIIKYTKTVKKPEAYFGWVKSVVISSCNTAIKKKPQDLMYDNLFRENRSDRNSLENLDSFVSRHKVITRLEDEFTEEEDRKYVMDAIYDLPSRQREVILGQYFENKKLKDIAVEQDRSEGAVKMDSARAKKKLQKRFMRDDKFCENIFYFHVFDERNKNRKTDMRDPDLVERIRKRALYNLIHARWEKEHEWTPDEVVHECFRKSEPRDYYPFRAMVYSQSKLLPSCEDIYYAEAAYALEMDTNPRAAEKELREGLPPRKGKLFVFTGMDDLPPVKAFKEKGGLGSDTLKTSHFEKLSDERYSRQYAYNPLHPTALDPNNMDDLEGLIRGISYPFNSINLKRSYMSLEDQKSRDGYYAGEVDIPETIRGLYSIYNDRTLVFPMHDREIEQYTITFSPPKDKEHPIIQGLQKIMFPEGLQYQIDHFFKEEGIEYGYGYTLGLDDWTRKIDRITIRYMIMNPDLAIQKYKEKLLRLDNPVKGSTDLFLTQTVNIIIGYAGYGLRDIPMHFLGPQSKEEWEANGGPLFHEGEEANSEYFNRFDVLDGEEEGKP